MHLGKRVQRGKRHVQGAGYEDSPAVAYTSIMQHIQDWVERHQREGRPRPAGAQSHSTALSEPNCESRSCSRPRVKTAPTNGGAFPWRSTGSTRQSIC